MNRRELDQVVVGMELTLISIIQGVALSFLAVATSSVLAARRWALVPYALVGLLVICAVWSRAVLHVVTIVRWPLELGRSFLCFAVALAQSLAIAAIDAPERWFWLSTVTGVLAWLTYAVDLRLIDRQMAAGGSAARLQLYRHVRGDQVRHLVLLVPAGIVSCAAAALAIGLDRDLFIGRGAHVVLGLAQGGLAAAYLGATLRAARRLAPLIDRAPDS
jgi:hypothetical protein